MRKRIHTTLEEFMWKRSFISSVSPARPHQSVTKNGGFWKRPLNRRNLKTPGFPFREDGKHLENGAFRHDHGVTIIRGNHVVLVPGRVLIKHKSKWPVNVTFLNSSGEVWTVTTARWISWIYYTLGNHQNYLKIRIKRHRKINWHNVWGPSFVVVVVSMSLTNRYVQGPVSRSSR